LYLSATKIKERHNDCIAKTFTPGHYPEFFYAPYGCLRNSSINRFRSSKQADVPAKQAGMRLTSATADRRNSINTTNAFFSAITCGMVMFLPFSSSSQAILPKFVWGWRIAAKHKTHNIKQRTQNPLPQTFVNCFYANCGKALSRYFCAV